MDVTSISCISSGRFRSKRGNIMEGEQGGTEKRNKSSLVSKRKTVISNQT